MSKKSDHAFNGERGLSSLRSTDAEHTDSAAVDAAESSAPVVEASWDPYQVWLTRVKQPREQMVRRQTRPVAVESVKPTSPKETTTLRALFHALHR